MFTKEQVLMMAKEYETEKKNVQRVPHYYKRNGKMVERSYPDYVYTDRYYELRNLLSSDEGKVFQCRDCGEWVGYFSLEAWCCDFENDSYLCGCCYEDSQSEDL